MATRDTLSHASRTARQGSARGTARKFDDHNLVQEVDLDALYSETHTGVERIQPVGITAVPLKQTQDQNQKPTKKAANQSDDFSDDQPKGPAAETFINYIGSDHSHPVVMASDDRRVRPYDMKEGENAVYHAAGSEQMAFFDDAGAYLVSLDGKSVKNPNGNETRMASLRHVTKDMQSHKIEEGSQQQDYAHSGKTVNTEVRCTAGRIEFRTGNKVVGYYDVAADTWYFTAKIIFNEATEQVRDVAPRIDHN